MATIKFSELRRTMNDHQTELDKQITAGKQKLQQAIAAGKQDEIERITKALECRARAKAALDGIITISSLTCCDQFQDCPDF